MHHSLRHSPGGCRSMIAVWRSTSKTHLYRIPRVCEVALKVQVP
jgi:hypothetical protein